MMNFRLLIALLCVAGLTACVSGGAARTELARYDLAAATAPPPVLPLRSIDVVGSSWLATPAMHYRLAGSAQRQQFAQNRWLAAPAEMVALRLKRGLSVQPAASSGQCNLRLELDDWVQVFADTQRSELVLEARATLFNPQGIQARQVFKLAVPAGSDALSAVAVSGDLVHTLAQALQPWIVQACK